MSDFAISDFAMSDFAVSDFAVSDFAISGSAVSDFVFSLIDWAIVLVGGVVSLIQPILIPLCLVIAWTVLILTIWSLFSAIQESISSAKQMHEIPCANCRYFTHNYHLKCPVHPSEALSEAAINCPDYELANIIEEKIRNLQ